MAGKEVDFRWKEVKSINCYALFMGYVLMAVRGLGYLVITWSTVVLLGGFVSNLGKKDFWSLTIITLVLIPRVSDAGLKEKVKYIEESFQGLSLAIITTLIPKNTPKSSRVLKLLVSIVVSIVLFCHLLVGPMVVGALLVVLYMCGPLFSAGISVWRLIERDYVNANTEEGAHLEPALSVLYSLATMQGLLFGYRFCATLGQKRLVNDVINYYHMSGDDEKELVEDYLCETVTKCEKDPSFFKQTNLATYAVEMITSESSSKSFLSGARILDALLRGTTEDALTAELIGLVASSSHVLEKLLQVLDSTSPHDEMMRMRELAANIMVHLAGRTHVMQLPEVIQCLGSLLDIPGHQLQEDYKKLMEKGFVILLKLADDKDNCRAISKANGMLSKVMTPVSSDLLHLMDHEPWSATIVAASLQVMCQLVATPGETGAQLRSQMSSNDGVMHGMEMILKCCRCGEQVRILTIHILTQLAMGKDEEFLRVNKEIRGNFIKMLPSIFTDDSKEFSIRKLGGEALVMLSKSESHAAIILKANDHVVRDLRKILLDDAANSTNRIIASKTLKHLYIHYKENANYLKTLKEPMEDLMPKVLREILPPIVLSGNDTLAENGTDRQSFPLLGPTDIEAQVRAPQDDGRINNTSTCQQKDEKKLHAALLSLAVAIFDKLISQDHNLAQLVDKISPGDSPTSFANKLNEMVRTKSQSTASCLSMMKNASKMVISMMKHSDSYLKEHFLIIFIQSLTDACKTMSCLESSMILYSANHGAVKPHKTLASLLKEAHELQGSREQQEM